LLHPFNPIFTFCSPSRNPGWKRSRCVVSQEEAARAVSAPSGPAYSRRRGRPQRHADCKSRAPQRLLPTGSHWQPALGRRSTPTGPGVTVLSVTVGTGRQLSGSGSARHLGTPSRVGASSSALAASQRACWHWHWNWHSLRLAVDSESLWHRLPVSTSQARAAEPARWGVIATGRALHIMMARTPGLPVAPWQTRSR
jgi:hypothetical protein